MADNSLITIYVNKIGKKITLKVKAEYYLKFYMPQTIKLLGSIKNKIIKAKIVKVCLIPKNIYIYISKNP